MRSHRWLGWAVPVSLLALTAMPGAASAETPDRASILEQARVCDTDPRSMCAHLQVLYINDFHGQLTDEKQVDGRGAGGAAYLAGYIRDRENDAMHTLFFGGGDLAGGSPPVSALLQDEPTLTILGEMGMDVSVVGNHEFDEGIAELKRLAKGGTHEVTGEWPGAKFPYLAANVIDTATGLPVLSPYQIFTIQGVPIGVIGVVSTETPTIVTPSGVAGLEFRDEAETANKYINQLKAQGIKAFIVIVHEGGTQEGNEVTGPIVKLVENLDDEVDLVLSGHSHTFINTVIDGKPVVQAYSASTGLADVDMILDLREKDVKAVTAEVVTTYQDEVMPSGKISMMVNEYKAKVAPLINRTIATSNFTFVRDRNPEGDYPLGNLIADAQRWAMQADFAFMNPGGIRADLLAGEVTWGELYSVQPFGNDMVTITMTGDQIYRVLNQQWQENTTRMLQISGLSYTWDPAQPKGSRIIEVRDAEGNPIDKEATYKVAINNFLADGGDGFTVFTEGTDRTTGPVDLDALVEYVKQLEQPFSAPAGGRIIKAR